MHPTEPSTTMTPGYPGLQNPPPAKGRVALGRAFEDVNTLKIILLSYKLSAFHTTSVSYMLMTCVKFTLFMNRHELCMRKKNLAIYSTHPPLESEAAFSNADSTVRVQQYEDTYVRSMEVTYKFKAVRRSFRPMNGSYPQVQSSTKKLPFDGWKLPTSSKQYEEASVRSMEVTYKFKAVRRNFRPIDGSYLQVQSSTKKLPSDRWKLPTSSKQYEETSVRSMEVTCKFKAVRRNFRPMDGSYPQVQVQQALRP